MTIPNFQGNPEKLCLKYELYINEKPDYFQLWFRPNSVIKIEYRNYCM